MKAVWVVVLLLAACATDEVVEQSQTFEPAEIVPSGEVVVQPAPIVTDDDVPLMPAPPELNFYTLMEVSVHDSAASCWTVVDDLVYDLTSFIVRHPGGRSNILRLCGVDGTDAFIDKHGENERAISTLEGFEIGYLI